MQQTHHIRDISKHNQYDIYCKGLQSSVEQFKITNPLKYEIAQSIGEDMMTKSYDLNTGVDLKGYYLNCKKILNSISQYGLDYNDLYNREIEDLYQILVIQLSCTDSINIIFNDENILNTCIQKVNEKIEILKYDN